MNPNNIKELTKTGRKKKAGWTNSFLLFKASVQSELMVKHQHVVGRDKVQAVVREAGEMWKNLGEAEKQHWANEAQKRRDQMPTQY
jgi:hypothetical protein